MWTSFAKVSPSALLVMLTHPLRSSSSKLDSFPICSRPSSLTGHRANRKTLRDLDRLGCSARIDIPRSVIWRHQPRESSSIRSKSWRYASPSSVIRSHCKIVKKMEALEVGVATRETSDIYSLFLTWDKSNFRSSTNPARPSKLLSVKQRHPPTLMANKLLFKWLTLIIASSVIRRQLAKDRVFCGERSIG